MVMQTVKRLKSGGGMKVSYTDSSARNSTIISGSAALGLFSTTDCYIKLGGSTVEASSTDYDMMLPAYIMRDIATSGAGYIAAVRVSASGDLHITQFE